MSEKTTRKTIEKALPRGNHIRVRPIFCGKRCRGCPHTYYAYRVWRQGKQIKEIYLGVCDSGGNILHWAEKRT